MAYDSLVFINTNSGTWLQTYENKWQLKGGVFNSVKEIVNYQDSICLLINADGLYQSGDSLKTFTEVLNNANITSIQTIDTIIFIGTTNEGVLRSNDFGTSWLPVNIGITSTSIKKLVLNGEVIYAWDDGNRVHMSSNNGDEWSAFSVPATNDIYSYAGKIYCVNQINHCCIGSGTMIYSNTNNEDNFTANDSAFINYYDMHNSLMKITSIGNKLFAGSEYAGIFISYDNGVTWSQANKGLNYFQGEDLLMPDLLSSRSYYTITGFAESSDSNLFFINSNNELFIRNYSDFVLPSRPNNFTVCLDSIDYNNFNLIFQWETEDTQDVSGYLLVQSWNNDPILYRDAPTDTIIYQQNSSSWYNREYLDWEIISHRIACSDDGDWSILSDLPVRVQKQPLSILETNLLDVNAYPNPVNDILYIELTGEYDISIYNSLGQKLEEGKLANKISEIDFSNFENGLYFISISDKNKNSIIRIIKQ